MMAVIIIILLIKKANSKNENFSIITVNLATVH